MRWSCDRAGWPVLHLPGSRLDIHLLPVAKRQFERFLADPGPYGDSWYEQLLNLSPRTALSDCRSDDYEMLFTTAVFPAEAQGFAKWLGSGFEIPRADDWRSAYRELVQTELSGDDLDRLASDSRFTRPAREIVSWIGTHFRPRWWADLALMRGGVLEWVRAGQGAFGGYGSPRPEFQSLILNPDRDPPVRPVNDSRRYRYFGLRLTRPLSSPESPP